LKSELGVEVIFTHSTEEEIFSAEDKKSGEAIEKNDVESIRKLIEERKLGTNTCDEYGNTALHYASQNGYLEIIDILLENGAEVNSEEKNKLTPLHAAISNNHKEIAKKLLGKGANPKARDSSGNSPLHFAAEQNNLELLKLVVGPEVDINDINAKNKYDWSVLHSAASGIINKKEKEN
ncbi:14176_t:CDS:2, partial [Racocetra persica]